MKISIVSCLLLLISPLVSTAFAHVAIFPREAVSGTPHHFFEVRAPVEDGGTSVELKIEIPPEWKEAGGQVDRVHYNPDWEVEIQRDEDNWIQSVTWHGAEAPSYAFVQFGLIMTLPDLTGMQQISAWQKYADGRVKAFIEDRTQEGAVNPKPGLLLLEDPADASMEPVTDAAPAEGGGGMLLYLGLSALVGGVIGGVLVMITGRR
jgi:uncharacterized protein YcnI